MIDITVLVFDNTMIEPGDGTRMTRLLRNVSASTPDISDDDLRCYLNHPDVVVLVARPLTAPEDIAGTLTLAFVELLNGTKALIELVAVDAGYQRRGVARRLTERAIDIAAESSARYIDLTSSPDRLAANGLYHAMGFEKRETNVYRFSF